MPSKSRRRQNFASFVLSYFVIYSGDKCNYRSSWFRSVYLTLYDLVTLRPVLSSIRARLRCSQTSLGSPYDHYSTSTLAAETRRLRDTLLSFCV